MSSATPFNTPETTPLTSVEVAKRLRSDIIFGRLRPRERLVEEELSQRFKVNRYTIRNALDQLEIFDLIVRRPNRGATVIDLSPEEVDQLYEMRAFLHKEAISRIPAHAFPELADRLLPIQSDFKRSLEERDLDRVAAIDSHFHEEIYQTCGNKYLAGSIALHWEKTVSIHSYALGKPALSRLSAQEHDAIIDAIRSGDRALITKRCNDHMLLSLEAYRENYNGWQDNSIVS